MNSVVISATGLLTPTDSISNQELVASFNQYVENYNQSNKEAIESGDKQALAPSSVEFIEKASGIKSRFVLEKDNILDPEQMAPNFTPRDDSQMSQMCEMGVAAAKQALQRAKLKPEDIDLVIVAASNSERAYPAIAVELQTELGCSGYAFDMNVACSSATFGMKTAFDAISAGTTRRALVVNPEICSGHLNFRDRDCHFIFGDVCTATILESQADAEARHLSDYYQISQFKLITQYSNNIRNNFGFLNRQAEDPQDLLFKQQGRKVFKEVIPMVAKLITEVVESDHKSLPDIRTLWLHQANINMNQLIAKKLLGQLPTPDQAPIVLDQYANTSSAGSVIAFHKHRDHMNVGEYGVLCSFGAGYSAGAILLKKIG